MLDERLIERVCAYLRKGNYRKVAFAACGVRPGTWGDWVKIGNAALQGRKPSGQKNVSAEHMAMCVRLVLTLEQVEAETHAALVQDLIASGDTKAIQWFLERRHNSLYNNNWRAKFFDDELGEEVSLNAREVLKDRLQRLVDRVTTGTDVLAWLREHEHDEAAKAFATKHPWVN